MYVSSPPRTTNGTTSIQKTVFARSGFGATNELARLNATVNTTGTRGPASFRTRSNMQSGIRILNGGFRDTDYYNYSVNCTPKSGDQYFKRTIPGHWNTNQEWWMCETTPGFGITGGIGSLGVGLPANRYSFITSPNFWPSLNLRNRCVAEALSKMKDSKFDLSETLVDAKSTVSLLTDRFNRVVKLIALVHRGRFREASHQANLNFLSRKIHKLPGRSRLRYVKLMKATTVARQRERSRQEAAITTGYANFKKDPILATSQFWLEIQYGWLPLLSDIHALQKLANEGLRDPLKEHYTVTRRVKDVAPDQGDPNISRAVVLSRKTKVLLRSECKLRFRISNSTIAALSQLEATNPLYLIWVSLPMSFVIDWLAPVSTWLRALSAHHGLDYLGGYSTQQCIGTETVTYRTTRDGYTFMYGNVPGYEVQFSQFRRYAHPTTPGFLPYVTNPLKNWKRLATSLALLSVLSSSTRSPSGGTGTQQSDRIDSLIRQISLKGD